MQAYVGAAFSIPGAAGAVHAHGDTILSRLDRIFLLTGRDPGTPRGIVLLALSLRLDVSRG